jgi:tight adherence protein C
LDSATFAVFVTVTCATFAMAHAGFAWRRRALRRLAPQKPADGPPCPRGSSWRDLVSRIGLAAPGSSKNLPRLRRQLARAGYRDPSADRILQGARLLTAALLGLAGVAAAIHANAPMDKLLLWAGAAGMAGYMAPGQYLSWRVSSRKRAVEKGLPNALDLMVVCVESGLGIDQTILQVAKELHHAHPEISDEFALMNLEMRAGKRRAEALRNMAARTGVEDVRKLVAVLIQTDRFGTSVANALRGHADYLRMMARQRAEERAAKLAVKLVFPIFFCVLPSLFVVTIGPVLTHLVRDLLPAIKKM